MQQKRNEKDFFFKILWLLFSDGHRARAKTGSNHSNSCAVIALARRGGQKSYSAGLGSELLINYLGSRALFLKHAKITDVI